MALNTTLLTSRAYGRVVGLSLPTAEVASARTWLPWWWQDAEAEPEVWWEAESTAACEPLVRSLELWVAEHARDVVFVHAGVVYVDGSALLLPGRSFAGKSTLVAALLEEGALYGSDEYAVIATDGLVHPYPRPVSLRGPSASRSRITVSDPQIGRPAAVGLVAHLAYDLDSEPETRPIPRSQSVLRLLDNTVAARSRPAEALATLSDATARSLCIAGSRHEASRMAPRLFDLLRG